MSNLYKGEIRDSIIKGLLEKVRKHDYGKYLLSVNLECFRFFTDAQVNFDFPVTALIGPNGGGKSTILGAVASAYDSIEPVSFFPKSIIGDNNTVDWTIKYEAIDKQEVPKDIIKTFSSVNNKQLFKKYDQHWFREPVLKNRCVKFFGVSRTVPMAERTVHMKQLLLRKRKGMTKMTSTNVVEEFELVKYEAERILGKSLNNFKLIEVLFTKTINQQSTLRLPTQLLIGGNGEYEYSEFNFGSGEASILRMISDIEALPNNSLVLLEELENGLHPVAVRRMVEYFIDVARRKTLQIIFTTHSDFALEPLPPEAIWASWEGKVQQGKLSIEALRAISGRVDKRLAIFVEDVFAKTWLETVLREKIDDLIDEVGIYAVAGDGNAVKTHTGHMLNPAISFHSLCFIDGDSKQKEDASKGIYRLPGLSPESTIFDSVLSNLNSNIALLTIACQRSISKQDEVAEKIKQVSHTNRDPHLLFNQIGLKIGFVSEPIVRGAFLSVWIQENQTEVEKIVKPILEALDLPPKDRLNALII
jgi:AAA15 family ATPase/GTPase